MTTKKEMNSTKKTARIVGVLFITAMVAGMLRFVLLDPILDVTSSRINGHGFEGLNNGLPCRGRLKIRGTEKGPS